MRIVKPQKLSLLTRVFEFRRRYYLSVGVLSLHDFSGVMHSEQEMWRFLPEQLGQDAAPDAGIFKSRCEVLVHGSAYHCLLYTSPSPRDRG